MAAKTTQASFDMNVEGLEELLATFSSWRKGLDSSAIILNAMKRIGKECEANAKGLLDEKIYGPGVPESPYYVRTGNLRLETEADAELTKGFNSITATVRSKVHYAKYIEFGTSKMKARAFLLPAAQKTKKQMQEILGDALMDYLKKGR